MKFNLLLSAYWECYAILYPDDDYRYEMAERITKKILNLEQYWIYGN